MDLIDLHTHTTASDGTFSPAEVASMAKKAGLAAVAITDHDTIDGVDEALERGRDIGLEVVPGVEISAEFPTGTMHILGYYPDYRDGNFQKRLGILQEARKNRNPDIVARLNAAGIEITMEEAAARAGDGQIGRPHFAGLMLEKGYVQNIQEAFDHFLAKGKPAYVDKFRFPPEEAVDMILRAGGVPVLAHPYTLKLDRDRLEDVVAELKEFGLAGLEVYYSDHTSAMVEEYFALAGRFDLIPTGGSDFHGDNKKEIELGKGRGDLAVPSEILNGIKNRRSRGNE